MNLKTIKKKLTFKNLIIFLNIIVFVLVLFVVSYDVGILFLKFRVILLINMILLILFFIVLLKNSIKKTVIYWLSSLVLLLFTLIHMCDINLSTQFTNGEYSILYSYLTGKNQLEIAILSMEYLTSQVDPAILETIEIPPCLKDFIKSKK